jgi:hypothetical protein
MKINTKDWIECTPEEGDTVKVEFSEFTKLGIQIGVFTKRVHGDFVVDFGTIRRYLNSATTFLVYK